MSSELKSLKDCDYSLVEKRMLLMMGIDPATGNDMTALNIMRGKNTSMMILDEYGLYNPEPERILKAKIVKRVNNKRKAKQKARAKQLMLKGG